MFKTSVIRGNRMLGKPPHKIEIGLQIVKIRQKLTMLKTEPNMCHLSF